MVAARGQHANTLRIIGGVWRGRKLRFAPTAELRPSPDRVRETLFNWLAGHIAGARCLDLFAGSGALGLEALSRGAAHCLFTERDGNTLRTIRAHLRTLRCSSAGTLQADATRWLQQGPADSLPFDVVFLDPPFARDLLGRVCVLLEQNQWLAPAARIYVESGRRRPSAEVPANWHCLHDKKAGELRYRLFVRAAEVV